MQKNEKPTALYQMNEQFVLREIAGEAVLIPVGDAGALSNSVISLNETSVFLWKLFENPSTVDQAIEKAKAVYSDPTGRMDDEIRQFAAEYVKYGLLKEVS